VRADFGLQRAHGGEPGLNNEPLGLATRLDLSIIGANTDDPKPLLRATGFDFVFGKIE